MSVEDKLQKLKSAGIRLQKPKYTNSIEIFIKGDWNDADYVTQTEFVSVDEFIELFPILKKISKSKLKWDETYKSLEEDEQELLEGYWLIPSGYESSIHTIEEIRVYFRCSDGNRYKIKL